VIVALLVNAASGKGRAPRVEQDLAELGAEIRRAGDEDQLRAAAVGADRVAVAGGDGSVAPAAAVAASAGLPLAVMPCGTANDFVRALGLPEDVDAACHLAVHGARLRTLELCHMNGRPFVNVANGGLAAAAARHAAPLKPRLGRLAYPAGAIWAGAIQRPRRCRVRCEGRLVFEGAVWQVTVASSGAFGGGSSIGPADATDGVLDVAVIPAGPRLRLAQRAWGMRSGRITAQREVRHERGSTVQVEGGLDYNVDGEIVRAATAEFTVEPAAFRLVAG
jgi:YegS/Rv2252/BmrU family lipid kinase